MCIFADHDLLVCPTIACMPLGNADDGNTLRPDSVNSQPVNRLMHEGAEGHILQGSSGPDFDALAGQAPEAFPAVLLH